MKPAELCTALETIVRDALRRTLRLDVEADRGANLLEGYDINSLDLIEIIAVAEEEIIERLGAYRKMSDKRFGLLVQDMKENGLSIAAISMALEDGCAKDNEP